MGLAAGAAVGTAAYYGSGGYYGGSGYDSGYGAYASAAYDTADSNTYLLRGSYISESDAVAYCAQTFRSLTPRARHLCRIAASECPVRSSRPDTTQRSTDYCAAGDGMGDHAFPCRAHCGFDRGPLQF